MSRWGRNHHEAGHGHVALVAERLLLELRWRKPRRRKRVADLLGAMGVAQAFAENNAISRIALQGESQKTSRREHASGFRQ